MNFKTFLTVDDIGQIDIFLPPVLMAIPPVITVKLTKGSSSVQNNGKTVLLAGDEKNFQCIPSVISYTLPPYMQPGSLELEEIILDSSHYSECASEEGKKLLVASTALFTAKFKINTKAAIPPTPVSPAQPDPSVSYIGKGKFVPAGINFHEN